MSDTEFSLQLDDEDFIRESTVFYDTKFMVNTSLRQLREGLIRQIESDPTLFHVVIAADTMGITPFQAGLIHDLVAEGIKPTSAYYMAHFCEEESNLPHGISSRYVYIDKVDPGDASVSHVPNPKIFQNPRFVHKARKRESPSARKLTPDEKFLPYYFFQTLALLEDVQEQYPEVHFEIIPLAPELAIDLGGEEGNPLSDLLTEARNIQMTGCGISEEALARFQDAIFLLAQLIEEKNSKLYEQCRSISSAYQDSSSTQVIFVGNYTTDILWMEEHAGKILESNYYLGDIYTDSELLSLLAIQVVRNMGAGLNEPDLISCVDRSLWIKEFLRFFIENRINDSNRRVEYGQDLYEIADEILREIETEIGGDFTILIEDPRPIYQLIGEIAKLERFPVIVKKRKKRK